MMWPSLFFFFNDTATTEIYTLSLHDALPISKGNVALGVGLKAPTGSNQYAGDFFRANGSSIRSEEHTSELQSQSNLVCRLLLEKKKHADKFKAYVARYNAHIVSVDGANLTYD